MKRIPLSQGKFAVVDDEDFERLVDKKWTLSGKYAIHCWWDKIERRYISISMHRYILNPDSNMFVDHINGDGLDNTRSNIRVCTKQQNCYNKVMHPRNSSGYRGVSLVKPTYKWKPNTTKWVAFISFGGKGKNLGYYDTPLEAARAYDKAAKNLYGDFARLNFP